MGGSAYSHGDVAETYDSFSEWSYRSFRKLLATVGGEFDASSATVVFQAIDQMAFRNYPWSERVRSVMEQLREQQLVFDQQRVISG